MMNCLLIVATSAAMVAAGAKETPSPVRPGLTEQIGSAATIPKSTKAAAVRVYADGHHNSPRRLKELSAANSRLIEKLSALPAKNVAPHNVNATSCATLICYHIAHSWQQYQDAAKTIRSSNGNHQQITEQFRQEEIRLKDNDAPYLAASETAKSCISCSWTPPPDTNAVRRKSSGNSTG